MAAKGSSASVLRFGVWTELIRDQLKIDSV